MNVQPCSSSRVLRLSMLAAALSAAMLAAPAWAGEVCDASTDNGEQANGSTATGNGAAQACGTSNTASGDGSNAFGYNNIASALAGNAFGRSNRAEGTYSNAFGFLNTARGEDSNAFGTGNRAYGNYSSAFGFNGTSTGLGSLVVSAWYDRNYDGTSVWDLDLNGDGDFDAASELSSASGAHAVAIGAAVHASGRASTAMGIDSRASGWSSSAFGYGNTAGGIASNAFGYANVASGHAASAFGIDNVADGQSGLLSFIATSPASGTSYSQGAAVALGLRNRATGHMSSALGTFNRSAGAGSSAIGFATASLGRGSISVGGWYERSVGFSAAAWDVDVDGDGIMDASSHTALAAGTSAVALGAGVVALGDASTALGVNTRANADHSVAIGFGAIADQERTIAVGGNGADDADKNRIVNLAGGIDAFDAVNVSQLGSVVDWLGGGAAFAGGAFTAPVYVIQSNNHGSVGAAFGAVDAALTDINARIVAAGGVQGERGYSAYELAVQGGYAGNEAAWLASLKGDAGPVGPQGGTGPAGQDGLGSVPQIEAIAAAGDAVTLQSAQDYADAGDAQTLVSANTHTDTVAVQTLQSANTYTDNRFAAWDAQLDSIQRGIDDRFHHQDRRIDRQGAMAGAFAGMAMNTAGLAGRNRVGVGVGVQGGEQALAVGYQRAISNRASVSLGGAFSSSEKSVMGGAGFSW